MKFLLNVGAEKAGTTWLYQYFQTHPEFYDCGKELNVIQRDDLVPTFPQISACFKKDLARYFTYFQKLNSVSGDFTHYEGSTENLFRLIREGFGRYDIDIVPVYIMRDPINRAWSAWNMLGGGTNFDMAPPAFFITHNYLQCKYKETVQALDNAFSKPLYFFYETFFEQHNIDTICNALEIDKHPAQTNTFVNKGHYNPPPKEFIELFGNTKKNREAVDFIFERFTDVPWTRSDYQDIENR